MTDRPTPERLAELRTFVAGEHASFAWRELLAELDAVTRERDQLKTVAGILGEAFGRMEPKAAEARALIDLFNSTVGEFFDGELPTPLKAAEDMAAEALRRATEHKARADYLLLDRDTIDAKRAEAYAAVARVITMCAGHRGKDWCERVLNALKGEPPIDFDVPHDAEFVKWLREIAVIREDGSFNVEQALTELSDYRMIIHEVSKVFDHVTGGVVSKPNTHASAVIALADDANTASAEEAVKDAREAFEDAAEERWRAAERADVIAHAREHAATGGSDMVGRITGDTLKAFANEVRDGLHVGKAGAR